MNLGFDAKRLFLNDSGLGNYSRTLVQHLRAEYPEDELSLFSPRLRNDSRREAFFDGSYHLHAPHRTPRLLHSWWRSARVAKAAKARGVEVFHGLSHELPSGLREAGIKSVVTIHDLIFLRHPEWYPRIDRAIYKKKIQSACRQADAIVAISQRTSSDLQELLNIPAQRIEVIYQGADPLFAQPCDNLARSAVLERFGIRSPFIVSVGTIESRKNQALLVEAFAQSQARKDHHLVLIGKQTANASEVKKRIQTLGLSDRVHLLDQVGYRELPALIQSGILSAYPSHYEGFGLPVLEALLSHTPVLAASGSCLEEVGGKAARYADPTNAVQWAQELDLIVGDASLRETMVTLGQEEVKRFDLNQMAREYHALYERLLT
jgi:glycosyltransferase involved in cell wall biosynthesis